MLSAFVGLCFSSVVSRAFGVAAVVSMGTSLVGVASVDSVDGRPCES